MGYVAEYVPQESLKTLLVNNWKAYQKLPKPTFIVVNDATDPYARFNLGDGDVVTIRQEGPEIIKYRGNVSYYDRSLPLVVEMWTKQDRQRLRDIQKQIKGIIFDHLFALAGYQIMTLKSYTELVNDALNIWKAELRLTADSAGICVDTNGDYDRYEV